MNEETKKATWPAAKEALESTYQTLEEDDPTPWCSHCGSKTMKGCECGPIPEND